MVRAALKHAPSPSFLLILVAGWICIVNFSQMLRLEPEVAAKSAVRTLVSTKASVVSAARKSNETLSAGNRIAAAAYIAIPERKPGVRRNLVLAGDYIYYKDETSWDSVPIVLESHKLIFFTIPKVGCTVWKQLFRRMMGYDDWMSQDYDTFQPHNPEVNGLKYLSDYTLSEASEMMTSSEWTRAMMVREPKKRFLSAFLDKSVGNFHLHIKRRCCSDGSCIEGAQTIAGFLRLCSRCYDDHWRAQSERLDHKYWPYIDHVGHVETAAQDAKELLQRVGAWKEFGATGWGNDGNSSIFESKKASDAGMNHSTYAEWQVWTWYTPETEQLVEGFYQGDYDNPLFQFSRGECLTCIV